MQSRHNGDFRRSLLSALAAMVAAAVPSLVPATALAEPPNKGDNAAQDTQDKGAKDGKKADKKAIKKAKKTDGKKAQKPAAKQGKQAQKPPQNDEPKADAKQKPGDAAAQKGKKSSKKTASRAGAAKGKKVAKKADSEAPQRPCKPARVTIDRAGLEGQAIALFDCHKRPSEEARRALSVLARPWGAAKPLDVAADKLAKKPKKGQKPLPPGELAPGVRWLDKGLLTRLDAIAHKFKDRPISLVSGYRPASRGSQHQTGRALDLRVAGVSNEELSAFCKTLPDTGCGYYPNSSFVHIDVRNPGTGTVSWIDASGPGEAPRYVTQWPLPQDGDHLTSGDEPHDSKDPWAVDPFGDDDDQEPSDDSKKPPPKKGGNFI